VKRKQVISGSLATVAAAWASPGTARAPGIEQRVLSRDVGSLVLPGGGARGAYEAGVIEGIRERANVADGTALPGVDIVVGTSIGAINGWFVATGQYTKLRSVWQTIAAEHIFAIKKQFRATVTPSSGVLTRVFQAALLSQGLTSNVTGLLDGGRIRRWLTRNIDPTVPTISPFVFTLTNLEHQRSEIFYRSPIQFSATDRAQGNRRVRSLYGRTIEARNVGDDHLVAALAGSSAIPIVLDPVTIAFDDGVQTYIDGGVADTAPLDVARALSRRVGLILVDPAEASPKPYRNAAAVGVAAFSIAQNRVLEASLRSAYLETAGQRLFGSGALTTAQSAYFENVFDVELSLIRPDHELAVEVAGFDDADGIAKVYEQGRQAGLRGFAAYDPGTFIR
jgi:predicted acylesterase/phospholipase RssA